MRGFLVLGSILAALVGWLFWASPESAGHVSDPATAASPILKG